jgi:hypothetical protein
MDADTPVNLGLKFVIKTDGLEDIKRSIYLG